MADDKQPVIVRDPRYVAGRQTIGQASSIDIFALLLEEAQSKYGNEHLETAPAFYEYGNALFRVAQRQQQAQDEELQQQQQQQSATSTTATATSSREAAALAAERRAKQQAGGGQDDDAAAAAAEKEDDDTKQPAVAAKQETNDTNDESTDEDGGVDKDLLLALEMMENAYAILDGARDDDNNKNDNATNDTLASSSSATKYAAWMRDQMPRILTGLGDVLSALNRHADALDAYLRALEHRQELLQDALAQSTDTDSQQNRLQLLPCRRRVVEANTLVVEELLACDLLQDVTTTETKAVLVPVGKGVEYATGYYEKARDELQETVLLMGQLQAEGQELGEEKENVCFAATLVMAAGESLAAIDEDSPADEPKKKKAKA